jgi:hypothetical protein
VSPAGSLAATGLPAGLAINTTTGVIGGTVAFGAATSSSVTITARDGTTTGSATFTWSVTRTNRAPVVTNPGNQTSAEGASVTLAVGATDPDGDTVSYSATGLPTGLGINTTTGVISGTVAFGAAALSSVTVTAEDAAHASGTAAFTWSVTRTNRAPVVTNPGNQTSAEGASVTLAVTAADPDGDPLSYSSTGLPAGLTMNATTGVISGTVAFGAPALSNVTVTAEDPAHASGTTAFTWSVTRTNRVPTVINPGNQTSLQGAGVTLAISGSDPDGDPLAYTASGLPAGLSLNASTGVISGAATTAGTYRVVVTVSDGRGGTASAGFGWTVTGVNRAPVASNSSIATSAGQAVSGILQANDPDGNQLTFSIVAQPKKGQVLITNATTGAFTYIPAAKFKGSDSFAFKANDGLLDSNIAKVSITVK